MSHAHSHSFVSPVQEPRVGGAVSAVLCSEEAGGQRGALAGRGRAALRTLPVGQVSPESSGRSQILLPGFTASTHRCDIVFLPPSFPIVAMENPCLTFIIASILESSEFLLIDVIHEIAHGWFGNAVTNATWEEMWLSEGLATYAQRRITTEAYGRSAAAGHAHPQHSQPIPPQVRPSPVWRRRCVWTPSTGSSVSSETATL